MVDTSKRYQRKLAAADALDRMWEENVYLRAEVADLKRANEQLKYEATHDLLTGLYNRAGLFDHPYEIGMYVTMIDVDGLKEVNDTLGHESGDILLRAVAVTLSDAAEVAWGIAVRLGGDEFVVMSAKVPGIDPRLQVSSATVQIISTLGEAMGKADTLMYLAKADRKKIARQEDRDDSA